MRLQFLIFCLALVYGLCSVYAEENVNPLKNIIGDKENYGSDFLNVLFEKLDLNSLLKKLDLPNALLKKSDYSNVFFEKSDYPNALLEKSDYPNLFERSLLRHRRTTNSLFKLPLDIPLDIFKKFAYTISEIFGFVFNVLSGKNMCSKEVKLSEELLNQVTLNPLRVFKTVICFFLNAIGSVGREIISKLFDTSIQFFKKVFLPTLHTTLNALKNTGLLPPQIVAAINFFNLIYKVLTLMGYI